MTERETAETQAERRRQQTRRDEEAEREFGDLIRSQAFGRTATEDRSGRFRGRDGQFVRSPLDVAREQGREPTEWEQVEARQLDTMASHQAAADDAARRVGFRDAGDVWTLGDPRLLETDPMAAARDLAERKPHLLDEGAQMNARIRAMAGIGSEPPPSPSVSEVPQGPGSGDGGARPIAEAAMDPDRLADGWLRRVAGFDYRNDPAVSTELDRRGVPYPEGRRP